MTLDESISPGQTGHITDHQTIATRLNTTLSLADYLPAGFANGDNINTELNEVSAAVAAAISADVTGITTTYEFGRISVELPPGQFLVTDPGALLSSFADPATRAAGIVFQGHGVFTTEIIFTPSSAGALIENVDSWSRLTFRDISFVGGNSNASFMDVESDGGPQDFHFDRCHWRGTWANCFKLTGTDNNDTWNFFGCVWRGTYTNVFYDTNNDQALTFNLIGCNVELDSGTAFNMAKGGYIFIQGGSFILGIGSETAAGTFFLLSNASPGGGVPMLHVDGVRFEVRSSNVLIVDSTWHAGNITFRGCNDIGYASNAFASSTRFHFKTGGNGPIVEFDSCRLGGIHKYESTGNNDQYTRVATYRNCSIHSWTEPEEFITHVLANNRDGAKWPAKFVECRSGQSTTTGSTRVFDTTVGNGTIVRAISDAHAVSFKRGDGHLPYSAQTTVVVALPLNAVVTRALLYFPVGAVSQVSTTWSFTITDGDGTTLFQWLGSTLGGLNAGINNRQELATGANKAHICDTTNRRTLTLTANADVTQTADSSLCLVEYQA